MKRLYVCYQSTPVGELVITEEHQYQFQYTASWLKRTSVFALSCSLPLQAAPFSQRFSYAFFSNLIPEGDLRSKIANVLGVSEKNDFALLEAIGGEIAGAISLFDELPDQEALPETTTKAKAQRNLTEQDLAEVIRKLDSRPFLVEEEGLRLSLAGAQNKLPLIYHDKQFALPLGQTPSSHILKPEPSRIDIPHLAVNEVFCMTLAASCGLQVADSELITIAGQNCFLVKRYDRVNHLRLHQEDFCQAMGILPSNKYENEGGPSYADCSQLITSFSSSPAADKKRLLQWTIFNYLIGNADAHGKNISFLHPLSQTSRALSPFYDLLSTRVYPELNSRMSMKIGKENRPEWVMQRHWKRYCEDVQIPYSMLSREAKALVKSLSSHMDKLAEEAPFHDYSAFISKIKRVVNKRIRWLSTRLEN